MARMVILGFTLMALTAPVLAAPPPDQISYQGVLRDDQGAVLSGDYDMVFTFFDAVASGNEILVDEHTTAQGGPVTVADGLFDTHLGGGTVSDGSGPGVYTSLAAVFEDFSTVYLQIEIAGELLTPRVALVSVGHALNAGSAVSAGTATQADDADLLDGEHGSFYQNASNINSGTLADARVAGTIARDNEIMPTVLANDGSGSGLDADGLDGQHGSYFVNTSTSQTVGGTKTFSNQTRFPNGIIVPSPGPSGNAVIAYSSGSSPTIWAENLTSGMGILGYSNAGHNAAIFAMNKHPWGTGLHGVGNNTTANYLTYGSGAATIGTETGLYAKATQSGSNGQSAIYCALGSGEYVRVCYRSTGGSSYKIIGSGSVSTVMSTSRGLVALICPESPEAWFEDYGSAELKDGTCHVELDPTFLDCITVNEDNPLKVFIQLTSPMSSQFYVKKDRTGFDVIALADAPDRVTFDYRVVSKRRDMENVRFEPADGPEPEAIAEEPAPPPEPTVDSEDVAEQSVLEQVDLEGNSASEVEAHRDVVESGPTVGLRDEDMELTPVLDNRDSQFAAQEQHVAYLQAENQAVKARLARLEDLVTGVMGSATGGER